MAKKMARRKPMSKKPATRKKPAKASAARKTAARKRPAPRRAAARGANGARVPWFDATKHKPLISEYAERMQPFIKAMADGRVDEAEVDAQEKRLMVSMKEVEPLLNNAVHGKVTRLLCEMAAYDLMQALHAVQSSRPQSEFRG